MTKLTTEEFIQKAKAVHGDKCDYSKAVYVNSKTKVCIVCPKHGEFWKRPDTHLQRHGCPKCASEASIIKLRIWTKERVFEEARKYATKSLFRKGNRSAYATAEKNGWFDEMTWFEQPNPNKPRVWSKEAVFNLAKQFNTKIEFSKANKSAYNAAWKNHWLEEMDWLAATARKPYTKDEVFAIARQYTTKIEFRRAAPVVYRTALNKGWLYEMNWFILSPKYDRHNYCIYVYLDEDNKVAYVGLTVDKKRRHYNHSTSYDRGGKIIKSPVYLHFQSINKPVPNPLYLEDRLTANEAQEKEHEWLVKYQQMGYRLLNTAKTGAGIGALGSASIKWTKPRVFKEARNYQSRSEFSTKCAGAYSVAVRRGWIDQMPWMKEKWSHPTPKWTKEAVFEESRKYTTRHEFEDNGKGAYAKALQYGWLDEMPWLKFARRPWTKEEVFVESMKYKKRTAFSLCSPGAYGIARKNKWLDQMPWLIVEPTYESMKDSIFEEARKYSSLNEFKSGNPEAYKIALKKRWLKEMIWLNPVLRLQLTKEEVFAISQKYKSKAAFYKGDRYVYCYAKKHGWLEEMTWFVAPHEKWTREQVFEEAREYSSRKEFERNSPTAYNQARKNRWLDEMPWMAKQLHDTWTKEEVFEESKKYTSRTAFSAGNGTAYGIARKNKWLDDMPWLVLTPIKWTKETVFEESRKYKSRGEFQKNSCTAYGVAVRNKWLYEMPWLKPQLNTWSKDNVIKEAIKYTSKTELLKKSRGAYRVALRNGWMDEIADIAGWIIK